MLLVVVIRPMLFTKYSPQRAPRPRPADYEMRAIAAGAFSPVEIVSVDVGAGPRVPDVRVLGVISGQTSGSSRFKKGDQPALNLRCQAEEMNNEQFVNQNP